jgi:hypothetical protein
MENHRSQEGRGGDPPVDRGQWDSRKAYKAEVMSLSTPLQCAVAAAPHTIPPTLLYCFSLSFFAYPMAAHLPSTISSVFY